MSVYKLHPFVVHGADGISAAPGRQQSRRVAITTRWLGDDVRFLPTYWHKAQQAVGIAKSGLALGSRAAGDYFPLVWGGTGDKTGGQTGGHD